MLHPRKNTGATNKTGLPEEECSRMSALDTNGPFEMEVVQEETPGGRTGMQGCRSMKAKAFWYPSWAKCGDSSHQRPDRRQCFRLSNSTNIFPLSGAFRPVSLKWCGRCLALRSPQNHPDSMNIQGTVEHFKGHVSLAVRCCCHTSNLHGT
jgi:hypothetical protein